MTLDRAIKVLDYSIRAEFYLLSPEQKDAIQLGNEALKRVKVNREARAVWVELVLPGETED